MKIFISYAHQDKEQVGEIKRPLEGHYGFDVFLAHEDISPSLEWLKVIISNLATCDVFIAFITNHFKNSNWTDQETGFALKRGIKIIPINAGLNPYGFISRYQALPYRNADIAYREILRVLVDTPDLKKQVLDLLITNYGRSGTFDSAASNLNRLLVYESDLTTEQKNEIVRLAGLNNQIFGGGRAKRRLKSFIRKYKEELNEEFIEMFKSMSGISDI